MDTEKARLLELRKKIDELSYQYYTLDKPTVTDYEYVMMYRELENIEKAHPDWVTPDSPTQRVGGRPLEGFEPVRLSVPMLSIRTETDSEAGAALRRAQNGQARDFATVHQLAHDQAGLNGFTDTHVISN